jgi:hypothetical protein
MIHTGIAMGLSGEGLALWAWLPAAAGYGSFSKIKRNSSKKVDRQLSGLLAKSPRE